MNKGNNCAACGDNNNSVYLCSECIEWLNSETN